MTVINKLEITAFGKFKNFTLNLNDGRNDFCAHNEWGKSTLTDFIVFMLYGFKKTEKKSLALQDNFLKKYLPWSDEGYIGGALELTKHGRRFRIERKTLESGRTRLSVLDSAGNEMSVLEPGKEFFGVDADTFLRSFLVRQTDIAFEGTTGIETALKNLVTTGDEDSSFDTAIEILNKKKNEYQHGNRRSGRIFELPKLITENRLKLSSVTADITRLENDVMSAKDTESQLEKYQRLEKDLIGKKDIARGNDAALILKQLEDIDSQIAQYQDKQDRSKKPIESVVVKYISDTFADFDSAKKSVSENNEKAAKIQGEIDNICKEFEDYELFLKNEDEIQSLVLKKSGPNVLLAIVGFVLSLIVGAVFGTAGVLFGLGVGIAVLLLGLLVFKKIPKMPQKYARTQAQLKDDFQKFIEIKEIITRRELAKEVYTSASLDSQKKCGSLLDTLSKIKEEYGISSQSELSEYLADTKGAQLLSNQIKTLSARKEQLLLGVDIQKLKDDVKYADGSGLTSDVLNEKIAKVSSKISELAQLLVNAASVKNEYQSLCAKSLELNAQITSLEQELKDKTYKNEVLSLAQSALTLAYEKINNTYSPILASKVKPYLLTLTGGKYGEITMDKEFNIRVKTGGEYRRLGYFSRGTADAVYLAVRLAMADILCSDAVPLVLDDPFWSFDSERLAWANELIDEIAKNRQIIVFTAR